MQTKEAPRAWGMSRTMVANLFEGVTKGFERKLEINGVGYRAAVQGTNLQLNLGYSHDVALSDPGRGSRSPRRSRPKILIVGINRQQVGQVAAEIREYPQAGALQGQGRQVRRAKRSTARKARRSKDVMAKSTTERRIASVRRRR